MRAELLAHPTHPPAGIARVHAELRRDGARLACSFRVEGDLAGLILPPAASPARADGLWRRTCCELFLRDPGGEGYVELNLSPSSEWAAYAFAGRRAGMRPLELAAAPAIRTRREPDRFTLDAALDLGGAPLDPAGVWSLAATAVIEEAGGTSWWALAHAAPAPDFHDPAGFRISLAAGDATP